jgi:hypothetical protein
MRKAARFCPMRQQIPMATDLDLTGAFSMATGVVSGRVPNRIPTGDLWRLGPRGEQNET